MVHSVCYLILGGISKSVSNTTGWCNNMVGLWHCRFQVALGDLHIESHSMNSVMRSVVWAVVGTGLLKSCRIPRDKNTELTCVSNRGKPVAQSLRHDFSTVPYHQAYTRTTEESPPSTKQIY